MLKDEVIARLAAESGRSKAACADIYDALTPVLSTILAGGGKVELQGVGVLSTVKRKARFAAHPRTGERITVPARRVVRFAVAQRLKEAVRG